MYTLNPTAASNSLYAEVLQNEGVMVSVAGTLYYEDGLGAPLTYTDSGDTVLNGNRFAAALLSNGTVAVAAISYSSYTLYYVKSSNWASRSTIASSSPSSPSVTVSLATDGSRAFVAYLPSSTSVSFATVSSSGPTTITAVASGELNSIAYLSMAQSVSPFLLFSWMSGSSSPYSVRFASVPATVPTAATSQNSWSKPGLSPYESFFQNFLEYVSPGNGLLSINEGTLALSGRGGLSLGISLAYSQPYAFRASSSPFEYDNFTLSNLGYGWSLNLPWLGTYYLHLADGQAYPYQWSGSTFAYHGAVDFQLVQNGGGGTYTLYDKSGTTYQFNSFKQLTSITDQTGNNTITFSYGAQGYVSQITDTVGRVVSFSYNSNNQLASISSGGRTWTLAYSGNDLVSAADPIGRATTYEYHTSNPWLVSGVLYPTGGKTTYSYGSAPVGTEAKTYYVTSRNVYSSPTQLRQSDSVSYDIVNGNVVWSNSTMSDGVSIQAYQDNNFQNSKNLMRIYDKTSSGIVTKIVESDYDTAGRVNETKFLSPSNALLSYSVRSYDNWGNVKYSKDSVGHETWLSYAKTNSSNTFGTSGCTLSVFSQTITANIHDAIVGMCSYHNGVGTAQEQTYYKYDARGNLLEQKVLHDGGWLYTDYIHDKYGNVVSKTDSLARTTYYHYSSAYQSAYLTLTSVIINGQNITTSSTYDSQTGSVLSQTDPNGYTTSYQYDPLGRLMDVAYPVVGGVPATKLYFYDDKNNVLTTTDEDGNMAKAYFDGLGRETSVVDYNGSLVYSTTGYTYNWDNQVATKTAPTGSVYTYGYDSEGRQVKITNPDGTTLTTSYDDVSNIKTVTDENGHQTSYGYDWGGSLLWVRQYTSPTSYYLTSYTYDQSGNLLSTTDPNGAVTTYQYHDLNRLVRTTYPDGTTESKSYDSVGNLVSRTTPAGAVISYSYDSANRLTKVAYPDSTTLAYSWDSNGNVLSVIGASASTFYAYNPRNWVSNQTEMVGGKRYPVLYGYDNVGNIVTTTYPDGYALSTTYDALNRVHQLGTFATFRYTVDGKLSRISYGDGQVVMYSYDSREKPTRILVRTGSLTQLDLNYTYDSAGNVLSIDGQRYSYDWLDRLTSARGTWLPVSYSYDGGGNVANKTVGVTSTSYKYGAYNRLASVASVSFAYDANGNTISKVNGSTSWSYSYDLENRLTKVQKNGVAVAENLYDGSGNLVKSVEVSAQVFGYQGINRIYATNLNSSTAADYFYANGLLVASRNASAVSYYQEDAIGSVRFASDRAGGQTYSSDYRPFGTSYGTTGSSGIGYAGKPSDSNTGLYYFGARWYDPAVGRFVTEDTKVGDISDPMSLNRYIYARDNPLGITDPTGHDWWSGLTSALSNTWNTVTGAATSVATTLYNAVTSTVITATEYVDRCNRQIASSHPDSLYNQANSSPRPVSPFMKQWGPTLTTTASFTTSFALLDTTVTLNSGALGNIGQSVAETITGGAPKTFRYNTDGGPVRFRADIYVSDTDAAVEVKAGGSKLREYQLRDYQRAQFNGGFSVMFVQNPLTGEIGPGFHDYVLMTQYGISYTQVWWSWVRAHL